MKLPVWFWPNTPIVSMVKFKSGYYGVRVTYRFLWTPMVDRFVDSSGFTTPKQEDSETTLRLANERLAAYWELEDRYRLTCHIKNDNGKVITKWERMK